MGSSSNGPPGELDSEWPRLLLGDPSRQLDKAFGGLGRICAGKAVYRCSSLPARAGRVEMESGMKQVTPFVSIVATALLAPTQPRSEERRVGKEC